MAISVSIDGVDMESIGVVLLKGSDAELMSFPTRKTVQLIEWPDADGFEMASTPARYEAKTVSLQWYCNGIASEFETRLNAFMALHDTEDYMQLYVRELGYIFSLRYSSTTAYTQSSGFTSTGKKWARITMEYVMDDPLQYINSLTASQTPIATPSYVNIDDVAMENYSMIVSDIYSTAFTKKLKPGVSFSSAFTDGNTTSVLNVREKKTFVMSCVMHAASKSQLLANYKALWQALNKPYVQMELVAPGRNYQAYYSKMTSLTKRAFNSAAKIEFELELIGYEI